jgi:SPP1 family predicted phage head-tail adaptor
MPNAGAGTFNRRVEIQSPALPSPDAFGESPIVWTTLGMRWASLKALTARELVSAQQVVALATHICKMRFFRNLSTRERIIYAGRVFNISGMADPGEARVETWVYLTERPDAALPLFDFTLIESSMYLPVL